MNKCRHILTLFVPLLFNFLNTEAQKNMVYKYEIHQEIGPAMSRLTETVIKEAEANHASYILIDLDTYGGMVLDGDKIRTALLKTKIPTLVFVRNNAASAGALISIACDSIYMTPGSTIGAASVVNEAGELMPEKYQSYMRKKMRATAEETGRNPLIAEGMTDENLEIDGIKEKGKIVTFSVQEAIKHGYCNAEVEKPEDILKHLHKENLVIINHQSGWVESIILWLVNPAVSGIFLLLIFGGIYFEFKAPGTFLPIGVSVVAALFYFAPLYLEGLAANWEILLFVAGVILVVVEIFVIPGFGITGMSGIVLIVAGLALALVRNINFDFTFVPKGSLAFAFLMVSVAMALPVIILLALGQQIFSSKLFKKMGVESEMRTEDGFSIRNHILLHLVGRTGTAVTNLRPSGKIEIGGEQYDALADGSFIETGKPVKVIAIRSAYLVVSPL